MKQFVFSLQRVLHLRQAQARIEEMKLERLYGQRTALEVQERSLWGQRSQSGSEIHIRGKATAAELAALDAFQQFLQTEVQRTRQARSACERRIGEQLQIVIGKRRDVKLFEKLKLQRKTAWSSNFDREIAQQAEESHLAKWNRENIK